MRYFIDTEFLEAGPSRPITLVSLGIVAEDGRELYVQNNDCPFADGNEWVFRNVYPALEKFSLRDRRATCAAAMLQYHNAMQEQYQPWWPFAEIHRLILRFIGDDPAPEFWGDYAAYDWVVFCQIFGSMVKLPAHFPMYINDLRQLHATLGAPKLPEQEGIEHHALSDARHTYRCWKQLHRMRSFNAEACSERIASS